jgi:hypothetical protein
MNSSLPDVTVALGFIRAEGAHRTFFRVFCFPMIESGGALLLSGLRRLLAQFRRSEILWLTPSPSLWSYVLLAASALTLWSD